MNVVEFEDDHLVFSNKTVSEDSYKYLKKMKYVEGRKPNIFLSFKVIEPTNDPQLKADYIKNRGLEDDFLKIFKR